MVKLVDPDDAWADLENPPKNKDKKELEIDYEGLSDIEDKLYKLKLRHGELSDEYAEKKSEVNHKLYNHDRELERMLDELRDIETTFRMLNYNIRNYKP